MHSYQALIYDVVRGDGTKFTAPTATTCNKQQQQQNWNDDDDDDADADAQQ